MSTKNGITAIVNSPYMKSSNLNRSHEEFLKHEIKKQLLNKLLKDSSPDNNLQENKKDQYENISDQSRNYFQAQIQYYTAKK